MTLFERDESLARMKEAFRKVSEGELGLVTVTGEAGIGKSAFLAKAKNTIKETAPDAYIGYGRALGKSYEPFISALSDALGAEKERNPRHFRALGKSLTAHAPDWLRVIPILGDVLGAATATVQTFRRSPSSEGSELTESKNHQYLELLRSLSKEHPVVLLLDDMHWSDESSIDLLFYLSQQIIDIPVLLVLAFRPEDLLEAGSSHPFRKILWRIERYNEIVRIELIRLSEQGIKELVTENLGKEPTPELLRWISEKSLGNPFYAEQYLGLLEDKAALTTTEIRVDADHEVLRRLSDIPGSIESILEERFDRLSDLERRTLQVASIVGNTFSLANVLAVTYESEHDTRVALQRLCQKFGLIKALSTESGGDDYTFFHNLVQSFVENRLASDDPPDYRALHLRCGESIGTPTTLMEHQARARHFHLAAGGAVIGRLRGNELSDEKAVEACWSAADALSAAGGLKEALRYSLWAREHADRTEDVDLQLEAGLRLGSLQQEIRLAHAAINTLEAAERLGASVSKDADQLLCEARLHLAKAYRMENRWEDSRQALIRAAKVEESTDVNLRALIGLLSAELDLCGEPQSLERAANTLTEALSITSNPALRSPIYGHLGLAYLAAGKLAEARRNLDAGLTEATKSGRLDRLYEQYLYAAQFSLACLLLPDARIAVESMEATAIRAGLVDTDVFRLGAREAALSSSFEASAKRYAAFLLNDLELARDVPQARDWALTHMALQVCELRDLFGRKTATTFASTLASVVKTEVPSGVLGEDDSNYLNRLPELADSAVEPDSFVQRGGAFSFSSAAQCSFNFYMADLKGFRERLRETRNGSA